MLKREDIVKKFSTFLSFRDPNSGRQPVWQADPYLERQMRRLVQSEPEAREEFWARYCLKIVRGISQPETHLQINNESSVGAGQSAQTGAFRPNTTDVNFSNLRADKHLSAYLQEACLWAAHKISQRFKFLRHKYSLEEYFQIANSSANQPEKLLKNFKFDYPRSNIEGYAKTALIHFIANIIYQHDLEAKREKFSNYGLLKDLTAKELREALEAQGTKKCLIESYSLVWECFNEICQPNQHLGSRSLAPPEPKALEHIAEYYQSRCDRLERPVLSVDKEKIQEILEICIQAARAYRTQRFLPLEESDNMPDPMPSLWDAVIQEEEWTQVQELVSRLFEALPEEGKTLFKLWQGLNLTQTEIADVLKNKYPELQKQYQVARQLSKYTKNFLKEFIKEWNKMNPQIELTDDRELEPLKDSLIESLRSHCQKIWHLTLKRIENQCTDEAKNPIARGQSKSEGVFLSLSQVSTQLPSVQQCLSQEFNKEIEKKLNVELNSFNLIKNKLAIFVKDCVQNSVRKV